MTRFIHSTQTSFSHTSWKDSCNCLPALHTSFYDYPQNGLLWILVQPLHTRFIKAFHRVMLNTDERLKPLRQALTRYSCTTIDNFVLLPNRLRNSFINNKALISQLYYIYDIMRKIPDHAEIFPSKNLYYTVCVYCLTYKYIK